ncbi:MAG: pro-sigmaK processing inhibitor BofA family protein [Acidaminococcaceae bacterium]
MGEIGSLLIALVILFLLVKVLSWPFKLVWNGILGAAMLWLLNLVGVGIPLTILNALVAGIFGIPGVVGLLVWKYLM